MAPLKSAQQEKFVTEWVAGRTQSDAYRRSYPRSQKWKPEAVWVQACELAKKPQVSLRYRELMDEAAELAVVDKAWVLKRLKKVAENCMQEQPVIVAGLPTGEYTFNAAGANRALELLGKTLELFIERREISGPGGEPLVDAPVDTMALSRVILGILATANIGDGEEIEAAAESSIPSAAPPFEPNSYSSIEPAGGGGRTEPNASSADEPAESSWLTEHNGSPSERPPDGMVGVSGNGGRRYEEGEVVLIDDEGFEGYAIQFLQYDSDGRTKWSVLRPRGAQMEEVTKIWGEDRARAACRELASTGKIALGK